MQKSLLAKSCFWRLRWRDFSEHGRLFRACRGFVLKADCNEKMNAEERQRLADFEKRLDGLEHEFGQLKLALDNSDREFDKWENRFDDLKR